LGLRQNQEALGWLPLIYPGLDTIEKQNQTFSGAWNI